MTDYEVGISVDQRGVKWLTVKHGERVAHIKETIFLRQRGEFWARLTERGIRAVDPRVRREIADLTQACVVSGSICAAERPGLYGDAFILPDGRRFGSDARVIDQLARRVSLSTAGDFNVWRRDVERFAGGQPLPMFVIALAFVGPLLELLPVPLSIGFELVGKPAVGKSTLLDSAASVWGAPLALFGSIARQWRTTSNALEQTMAARNGCVLALDEANMIRPAERGEALWLVAEGRPKHRMGDEEAERCFTATLSTSNQSISTLMARDNREAANAIADRIITLRADWQYGAWRSVPAGFSSVGQAAATWSASLQRNHGWAIGHFLERLCEELSSRPDELRADLARDVGKVVTKLAGSTGDGSLARRARAFGIVYAAGKLATRYGGAPLNGIGRAVVDVWEHSRAGQTTQGAATATFVSHCRDHWDRFLDLDEWGPEGFSAADFEAAPGMFTRKGHSVDVLMSPAVFDSAFGPRARAFAQALLVEGVLRPTPSEHLQAQVRVHREASKTRCYRVCLGSADCFEPGETGRRLCLS